MCVHLLGRKQILPPQLFISSFMLPKGCENIAELNIHSNRQAGTLKERHAVEICYWKTRLPDTQWGGTSLQAVKEENVTLKAPASIARMAHWMRVSPWQEGRKTEGGGCYSHSIRTKLCHAQELQRSPLKGNLAPLKKPIPRAGLGPGSLTHPTQRVISWFTQIDADLRRYS